MMYELIAGFPVQIMTALDLCRTISLTPAAAPIQNVLLCGLGGSGIAGDLAYDLTADSLTVPLMVSKNYDLPAYASSHTLILMCSYSGNTEETISACTQAIARGLRPVCISSGGKLKELAQAHGLDYIALPTGYPPRTTLGFGSALVLHILHLAGVSSIDALAALGGVSTFLATHQEEIKATTQQLATSLKHKNVILYSEDKIKSAALRLKQQINENSKINCWYSAIPELNHNELVGWRFPNETLAVLYMRNDFEHPRNGYRFGHILPVLQQHVSRVETLHAKGGSLMEQYFYLIHAGDWLSYYLALAHDVDPVEVKVIDSLKAYLTGIK
jgi:glucose/mannose-6-phosphate isomerase